MLAGAMAQLKVGDPAKAATDIGPIIDAAAAQRIDAHITAMRANHRIIAQSPLPADLPPGHYIAPTAIAIARIGDVTAEIFGPVLHLLRFAADDFDALIDAVNAAGYGLTMGLHSRIDARVQSVAARAKVGNLYVNRNQIGAVVGVQPFGGEGLSGTGPKAGGPHYLLRLSRGERPHLPMLPDRAGDDPPDSNRAAMAQVFAEWAQQWRESESALALLAAQASERLHRYWGRAMAMPGPTGEANQLHLHPRGQILCLGGEAEDDLLAQALLTLASGSRARVVGADRIAAPWLALHAALARHDRAAALAHIDPAPLAQLLGLDYDAVLAEGAQRRAIAPLLAARTGAIIPILSRYDDPYALCVERTVTTDLTAAGGDTDLLSR
jgi:RHH-type proline utilization regulon transcriptional repressor/proline dehydrogenase/delta 1-pyrroline-5-carboxylate dehydrogenase